MNPQESVNNALLVLALTVLAFLASNIAWAITVYHIAKVS